MQQSAKVDVKFTKYT